MTLSEYTIEFHAETKEKWVNGRFWQGYIPEWFILKDYVDYIKKYDLTSWIKYEFDKFREEKTGLKFIQ